MKNSKSKIWFIVLISIFGVLWLTSLTFFGISTLSESITDSIQTWYSDTFTDKTLDLSKVSLWATIVTTTAVVITLLWKEIKKKYLI